MEKVECIWSNNSTYNGEKSCGFLENPTEDETYSSQGLQVYIAAESSSSVLFRVCWKLCGRATVILTLVDTWLRDLDPFLFI